jgi:hypothetical protein
MTQASLLQVALLLALLLGCASEAPTWPPPGRSARVTDLGTAASAQAFYDSTWPAVRRAADAHGYDVDRPRWWVDGYRPWRVTPEARLHGHVAGTLRFQLIPRAPRAGAPQSVELEFVRPGHTAPWTLVTYDGFLQFGSGSAEDASPEVVGVPALEVALHGLTTHSLEADADHTTVPKVSLQPDSAAWHELATFLAPFDSTIRRVITEAEVHWRYDSPYDGLGVAPVDSLDLALGFREGDLRIWLTETARLHADWTWFELHFVRAGPDAPWVLLRPPEAERVPRGRSAFHTRVRGVESRVHALFTTKMSMEEWWELRELRRAGGDAIPALQVGR